MADPSPASPGLGEIALSLSGGGFRAAGFHLGVLDALERLGLLEDVTVLSTASGGSFVGAALALSRARKEPFRTCFERLHAFLAADAVPGAVLAEFEAARSEPRARSLVVAAARAYDRLLFEGATLGELLDGDGKLRDVMLNATELTSGIAFRFQRSASGQARIGNGNVWIPPEVARTLRVADVVAASSCFPGAFEPMVFPDDFRGLHGAARVLEGPASRAGRAIALMDGGIYDNQAVDGVRRAAARSGATPPAIHLVSDTAPPYPPMPPSKRPRAGALWWWVVPAAILAVLAWLAVRVFAIAIAPGPRAWDVAGLVVAAVAVAGGTGARAWFGVRGLVARIPPLPRGVRAALLRTALRLRLGELGPLLGSRLRSVLELLTTVFTYRVRRLEYDQMFAEPAPRGPSPVAVLVYKLADERPRSDSTALAPSEAVREVARRAVAVRTALWYAGPDELRALLACGQLTACAALLEHAERAEAPAEVVTRLRALWDRLQEDPYALVPPPRAGA
jgi:predicted acylesterase/phospholipase RssA